MAAGAGIAIALQGPGNPSQGSPSSGPTLGPVSTPPPTCVAMPVNTTPEVCVSQPTGDSDTVFVIHGSGFAPFTTVTVSFAGQGSARYHAKTDLQGTFNYAFDQGHYFFSGTIPAGTYTAVVTSAAGTSARASFQVHPPPGTGPPPGSGIPPGSGPPPGTGPPAG
jgi:hypothetical protein